MINVLVPGLYVSGLLKNFLCMSYDLLSSFVRATNDCSEDLGFRAHFVQKMPFGCP